jgi:hypothetical protein
MSMNWTDDDLALWWPALPPTHRLILAEACGIFGINPDPDAKPRELLSVRALGNPRYFEEPAVRFVTAGGKKLRWPIDADTERTLRHEIFGAIKKRGDVVIELPLPTDLTLPDPARTGIVPRRLIGEHDE